MEQGDEGFLPPEPAGPEPDVGGGQPAQPPGPQQPAPGYQPPPAGYRPPSQQGYQPPPPEGYQPPPQQGYQAPYQPPPYQPPAPAYYGGSSWQAYAQQPGNGQAVAGFVVSAVSTALWLFSFGLITPLSIPGGIVGMVLARQGRQKVENGETTKNKELAVAGWWIGLAILVLSVLSTIAWVLIFVLAANSNGSFDNNVKHELQDSQPAVVSVALTLAGLGARLLS